MATAELSIVIQGKDEASKIFHEVSKSAGGLGSALSDVGKIAAGFLTGAVIQGGISKLTGFLSESTAAAKESAAVQAQLQAALTSTGGAAGMTLEALNKMSSALQDQTNFDDEAIGGAQALLLTFTSIGKDVFPGATAAVLDMSQALGQDLKSSSIQLGKALNDPTQGMTALRRVGVSFSEDQQKVIKAMQATGNLAGAQKLILAELNKEFGGSAAAAVKADGGITQLKNKMNDLQETIGAKLIPIQVKFKEIQYEIVNFLVSKGLPVIERLIEKYQPLAEKYLPQLVAAFSDLPAPIQAFLLPAAAVITNFDAIKDAVEPVVHLFQLGFNGGQIGGELNTIHTAAFQVGKFFRDVMVPAFNDAQNAIHLFLLAIQGGSAGGEMTKLQLQALALGTSIREMWFKDIKPAMIAFADIVVTTVKAINDNWSTIGPFLENLAQKMIASAAAGIKAIGGIVEVITGLVQTVDALIHGDWSTAWDSAKGVVEGVFKTIVGVIDTFTGGALSLLYDAGKAIIEGLWKGMKDAWEDAKDWLGGLPGKIKDLKGPIEKDAVMLFPEGQATMQGYIEGLKSKYGDLKSALSAVEGIAKGTALAAGRNFTYEDEPALALQKMLGLAPGNAGKGQAMEIFRELKRNADSTASGLSSLRQNIPHFNAAANSWVGATDKAGSAAGALGSALQQAAVVINDYWSAQSQQDRSNASAAARGSSNGMGQTEWGGVRSAPSESFTGGNLYGVGPGEVGGLTVNAGGSSGQVVGAGFRGTININVAGSLLSQRDLMGIIRDQLGSGAGRGIF